MAGSKNNSGSTAGAEPRDLSALFSLECEIAPGRSYDHSAGGPMSGERRLMAALLADAINVFRKGLTSHSVRQRLLYRDAERWMTSQGQSRHAFSFQTVCDALGLDPALLRRRMIEWKHSVRHSPEPSSARPLRIKFTPPERRLSHKTPRSRRLPRAF